MLRASYEYRTQQTLAHLTTNQPFPVLGEHRHVPTRSSISKPQTSGTKGVVQLLHQLALRPNREQELQKQAPQRDDYGRDRRKTATLQAEYNNLESRPERSALEEQIGRILKKRTGKLKLREPAASDDHIADRPRCLSSRRIPQLDYHQPQHSTKSTNQGSLSSQPLFSFSGHQPGTSCMASLRVGTDFRLNFPEVWEREVKLRVRIA